MSEKIYLSVLIPMYNEMENLERGVLDRVEDFMQKQGFFWEVIISDDGSTDNSLNLVKELTKNKAHFWVLENEHGGKPHAIWQAVKKAKGDYVLFDDMDQSTPINELKKLLPFFNDYPVIIGSRGIQRENYSLLRRLGSAVFLLLRKLILLRQVNDTQCGFKVFKTKVVRDIFPCLEFFRNKKSVQGWKVTSYDVELLFLIAKKGLKIKEVEVKWKDEDKSTGKRRNYLKESAEMLRQIIRVKLNDWRGLYSR